MQLPQIVRAQPWAGHPRADPTHYDARGRPGQARPRAKGKHGLACAPSRTKAPSAVIWVAESPNGEIPAKQFIAPLPIPPASAGDCSAVAHRAKGLQAGHTRRWDTLISIVRRLSATRLRNRPETWLFP